jgi:hypothetical protein
LKARQLAGATNGPRGISVKTPTAVVANGYGRKMRAIMSAKR